MAVSRQDREPRTQDIEPYDGAANHRQSNNFKNLFIERKSIILKINLIDQYQ